VSGGSFNYASDASELEDLLTKRFDLQQLRDRLYSHADGIEMDDVAADFDGLLAYVAHVEKRVAARLKRIQPVLHAVEWRDSADWGPDKVRKALADYRGADEPPAYATPERVGPASTAYVAGLDEAHLDEPLSGKLTFIHLERFSQPEARTHMTEHHAVRSPDDMEELLDLHTHLHRMGSGHCHAKAAQHKVVEAIPLFENMGDDDAIEHMSKYHGRAIIGPLGPEAATRLIGQHQNAHDHGLDYGHEHRRH